MPSILIPRRAPTLPRRGALGSPFTRKAWDNPVRYKLNAYGDEMEYAGGLTAFRRRWKIRGIAAPDIYVPDRSSHIEVYWGTSGAIYIAAPSGDFEIVVEMCLSVSQRMTGPLIVDSTGAGIACSPYSDGSSYNWVLSSWVYSGTGNHTANPAIAGKHVWYSLKKSGTTYAHRYSTDGATWSGSVSNTSAIVPAFIGVGAFYNTDSTTMQIHRFNVYPGPTFFPG